MGKKIGAVLAGAFAWAVPWIGTNAALAAAFPDIVVIGEPLTHLGMLLFLAAFGGVALSLLAGYVTAAVKGDDPMGTVWALAVLQMAMGLFFEITGWDVLPLWYHLIFLACIIPMTVLGGKMRAD